MQVVGVYSCTTLEGFFVPKRRLGGGWKLQVVECVEMLTYYFEDPAVPEEKEVAGD